MSKNTRHRFITHSELTSHRQLGLWPEFNTKSGTHMTVIDLANKLISNALRLLCTGK
jgi:hypothetical protein